MNVALVRITGKDYPVYLICAAGELLKIGIKVNLFDFSCENFDIEKSVSAVISSKPELVFVELSEENLFYLARKTCYYFLSNF